MLKLKKIFEERHGWTVDGIPQWDHCRMPLEMDLWGCFLLILGFATRRACLKIVLVISRRILWLPLSQLILRYARNVSDKPTYSASFLCHLISRSVRIFKITGHASINLVGGLEHFLCFHILGIIIPTDFHMFQRGRSTTNQFKIMGQFHSISLSGSCKYMHWWSGFWPRIQCGGRRLASPCIRSQMWAFFWVV